MLPSRRLHDPYRISLSSDPVTSPESEQLIQADVFLSRIHTRPIYFELAYLINCLKDTGWIRLLMSISKI